MYWFWYITITCKVLDKNPERWLCKKNIKGKSVQATS